ncbi:MAG: HEAT repeat domain-containing protein [Planctomycetota bacterium]
MSFRPRALAVRPRRARSAPWAAWVAGAVVAGACASAPKWELADPGAPDPAQKALLVEAERHYRAGEPFDALRAQITADRVTAWWFTRMVVRDVVVAREGTSGSAETTSARAPTRFSGDEIRQRVQEGREEPADSDALLRATVGIGNPLEQRATAEIERLGTAALPCLVMDLASHPQTFVRQIGIDLIGRLGEPALPLVVDQLGRDPEPARRRTAALATGAMPASERTAAQLYAFGQDPHYAVRAGAWSGLGKVPGAEAAAALRRALETDPDPFARRAAARALANHRRADSAHALVAYLQRCQRERDADGADAAQDALQELSGTHGLRSATAWRQWASLYAPQGG